MAHPKLAIFRRRLFTTLAILSLLLCLATLALWVRSYRLTDQIEWRSAGGVRAFGTASGKVVVQLNPGEAQQPKYHGWGYRRMSRYSAPSYPVAYAHLGPGRTYGSWEFKGLGWYTVRDQAGGRTTTGVAPFSFIAAATAVLPLIAAVRCTRALVGHPHRSIGLCVVCGYDLRATPDRCPECGTVDTTTETQRHSENTQKN